MSKANVTPDTNVTGQTNGARRTARRAPVSPSPDTNAGDPAVAVPAGPAQVIRHLALPAMFMRPAYLAESAWLEHVPFAFWLVEAHRPGVVVELGTHYGVSYFAFCQAVERLGLDTRCFAVDTWQGDEHAGFYGEEVFEQVRAHNDAQYSGFSRLVRSTFDEALAHFSDGSVDLLHIDGLHTLEAVRHDFDNWLPKLSERGLVVLHDSNVRERQFGVFRLVEELRGRYPAFEFVHGHGLAVLGVGQRRTEAVDRLFAAVRDEAAQRSVRAMFARLGRATADTHAARGGETTKQEQQAALAKQAKELASLREARERDKSALETRTAELKEARAKLESQSQQQAAERARLEARATLLLELRGEWREEAARLDARADRAAAEVRERTDALLALHGELRERERLLSEARAETARETESGKAAREELERHGKALAAARSQIETEQQASASVRAELESRQGELDDARQAIAALQARLEAEQQASASAQADGQAIRAELEQERAAHAATRAGMEAESLALASARSELREACETLESEREARAVADARLEVERQDAASVQAELAAVREQAAATAGQLDAAQHECAQARESRDAAEGQLEREREANTALHSELEAAAAALHEEQQAAAAARKAAEQAAGKTKTAADEAAKRHREAFDAASAKLRAAEEERDRLRAESESGARKLEERFAEVTRLTQRLRDAEARVKQLEGQVGAALGARLASARLLGRAVMALGRYTPERPPRRAALRRLARRLADGGVLDTAWYLERNRDVAEAALDPAAHYLLHGVVEGREPRDIAPLISQPAEAGDPR